MKDLILCRELYQSLVTNVIGEGDRSRIELVRTVFNFINGYFHLHLPAPIFATTCPERAEGESWVGRFECVREGKKINRAKITLVSDYDYTFGEALSIVAHEVLHYYIAYRNLFDLWDHGPTYLMNMALWNLDFKELGFPRIKLTAHILR